MTERRRGTQSIDRATALLRIVAMGGRPGMRLKDIVSVAGLAEATVVRILQGLVATGMLARRERSARFALGQLIEELGLLTMSDVLAEQGQRRRVLRELADTTGETIYLSRRSDMDTVCLDAAVGFQPVQSHPIDVGVRRPLGAGAAGLAILAAMPEPEALECISTNATRYRFYGLDAARVEAMVASTRQQGYALLESLTIRGVSVVAMSVPGLATQFAVGVAGLSTRLEPEAVANLVPLLRERLTRSARPGGDHPEHSASGESAGSA